MKMGITSLNLRKSITVLVGSALLVSCIKMGEDYVRPKVDIQDDWATLDNDQANQPFEVNKELDLKWWEKFNDLQLASLVETSLVFNKDIKSAEARIKEAISSHKNVFSSLLPQINGTGSATRERLEASSGSGLDRSSNIGIEGTWDLDIFGSKKRKLEAALAEVDAKKAERDSVKLAIIAEVARNYITLRQTQTQKRLILENINLQTETLKAAQEKRKVGEATDLEVTRAEAQIATSKERLLQINTNAVVALNRLHVLTGEGPDILWKLMLKDRSIPIATDHIVVTTPLDTIAWHPDVKAAERSLANATALTGAAFADLFPNITLSGFFGAEESNLFGAGTPWNIAGSALIPLFNFGKLRSLVDVADARQEQALLTYQQTILLTLEAVENAFVTYQNDRKRMQQLETILKKRQKVVNIAKEQYKAGVISQLDLLIAQEDRLNAENNLAIVKAKVADDVVLLYQSLGAIGENYIETSS